MGARPAELDSSPLTVGPLLHRGIGEVQDCVTVGHKDGFTPVALLHVARRWRRAVLGVPVDLDYQPRVGDEEVDLGALSTDSDVGLRLNVVNTDAIREDCRPRTATLQVQRSGRWVTVDRVRFTKGAGLPNYLKGCSPICLGTYNFRLSVTGQRAKEFALSVRSRLYATVNAPKAVAPGQAFTANFAYSSGRPGQCKAVLP